MQLHDVVANAATTEGSAEEVKREVLKTRDATLLALAVLLAVAVAYGLRIGDYRAIYAIETKVVCITDLFHRGKGDD